MMEVLSPLCPWIDAGSYAAMCTKALRVASWSNGKGAVSGANHSGRLTIPNVGGEVEQLELLHIVGGNENDSLFGEQYKVVL